MNINNQNRVAIIDACRSPFVRCGTVCSGSPPQLLQDIVRSGKKIYEE
jgi:hypothetical protein